MRQQQQRSRNRNRNRKSSNPLSRNFESNGPDVKIRGNAAHIAEKYNSLARDAQTSGDTVMAENYYQHAEHYLRIIAASQQNNNQPNNQANSQQNEQKNAQDEAQSEETAQVAADEKVEAVKGEGPQPELPIVPAEVKLKNENSLLLDDAEANGDAEQAEPSRTRRNGRKPANGRRAPRANAKKADSSKSKKAVAGELSEDAALLPSSLMGTVPEKDGDAAPTSSKE